MNGMGGAAGDLLGNDRADQRSKRVWLEAELKWPYLVDQTLHDRIGGSEVTETGLDLIRRMAHAGTVNSDAFKGPYQLMISIQSGLRSGSERAMSLMPERSPVSKARLSHFRASPSWPIWQA